LSNYDFNNCVTFRHNVRFYSENTNKNSDKFKNIKGILHNKDGKDTLIDGKKIGKLVRSTKKNNKEDTTKNSQKINKTLEDKHINEKKPQTMDEAMQSVVKEKFDSIPRGGKAKKKKDKLRKLKEENKKNKSIESSNNESEKNKTEAR